MSSIAIQMDFELACHFSFPIPSTTCSYNYVAYLHVPAIIKILGKLNYHFLLECKSTEEYYAQ